MKINDLIKQLESLSNNSKTSDAIIEINNSYYTKIEISESNKNHEGFVIKVSL